ncbi:hypothetical protein Vadar_013572 [Vaccinium darrowii]|uniref:Uncharacterized protein n=1 Tax=Vaccinium darrowii TaxID=229202 RepID=A0ACB7Y6P1_9ERIC|nr:hypothetical protein Vadar_013572 [Vaccinium darrowii]
MKLVVPRKTPPLALLVVQLSLLLMKIYSLVRSSIIDRCLYRDTSRNKSLVVFLLMEAQRTSYHRRFSSNGDLYTLFVDNLPNKTEVPWFRKFFSNFGKVIEAFIPNKRSMKTGNKFGFIRYTNNRSAINTIAQASGLWIGRRNLIVKQASYGRRNHRQDHGKPTSIFNRSTPLQYSQTRTDGGKEYRYSNWSFTQLKELEKRVTINLQPTASEWLWRSAITDLKEVSTPEII